MEDKTSNIMQSGVPEFEMKLNSYQDAYDINCLLECPIGTHFFDSFLVSEYASENLLGYLQIRTLASMRHAQDKRQRMEEIYHNFIRVR